MNKYIELLSSLIAIPSVSREESAVADHLEAWLRRERLSVARIGNNLVCADSWAPDDNRRVIMLNAHIDTVKPAAGYTRDPFTPHIEGDCLYGLGANDDGGALVALLATYMHLRQTEQSYKLIFTATAEEEVSGAGGLDMILPHIGHVDFAIIGEPTGMQMAVAEKGLMVLDCTACGRSGHAARNEGDNALYRALDDIAWFRTHRFDRVSPFLGEVKMTVTQIQAGSQHNVVPDECRYVVDVRPNGMYTNAELLSLIKQSVKSDVVARSTRLNSSHISVEHPVVQRGVQLGLTCFGSPTMSNMALSPFPTLKIGPGDSARSHTADEYIKLSEIERAVEMYVKLIDGITL
jgi:acetylornithine deacetylase